MNIKNFFEARAIKKFMTTLSVELKDRYGGSDKYSYPQVNTTINELELSNKYADLAYFVYCDAEESKQHGFYIKETTRFIGIKNKIESQGGACGSSGGGFWFNGGGGGSDGGGSDGGGSDGGD